jgi:Zn-dependent protease with chaperone function/uncharacterized tellurite resistance protein B-like protein
MDFFAHQDRARRRSGWMVLAFAVSVVLLVAAVDAAAYGALTLAEGRSMSSEEVLPFLGLVTAGVLLLVLFGSLYKTSVLAKGGGAAVAESLGGRLVAPGTSDAGDRRLLNVVEEMALASSLPTPRVYVLENEPGINAFAAGLTHGDAVVAVTRGTLEQLTRDELQGVVAHEFSHVLNGDMRLNLRLLGLVHGILVIALTGRMLISVLRHVRVGGGKKGSGGAVVAAILGAGLILFVLGWVGYAAGRLIKAAVNRQREFLADAAAVQFTRNPSGLSGALQKILRKGSRVKSARAAEVSHLFIASALRGHLLATHPLLEARLDAIDPGWRGAPAREGPGEVGAEPPARGTAPAPAAAVGFAAEAVAPSIGRLEATSPAVGEAALAALPADLRDAASDPWSARALVLAAIADRDPAVSGPALEALKPTASDDLVAEARRLQARAGALPGEEALSLVLLALPALRQMSDEQRAGFHETLVRFVSGDGVVTLHEHALAELAALHLGLRARVAAKPAPAALAEAKAHLLAVLARSEAPGEALAARAYALGARRAGLAEALPPAPERPDAAFHRALSVCRGASPDEKRALVTATAWTVSADGRVSPTEGALLRLVVDALDCPMPRFDPTAIGAA